MDRFEISMLRDIYGALLTDKQNEILRMRYDEDLSFGEIAAICSISRPAVLDAINKAEKHLCEFESTLHCLEKQRKILSVINDAQDGNSEELKLALASIKTILEE